jgi:type III pantothenate kinase
VVPSQGELWHHYPQTIQIQLADVPLQNVYPTLGLDRAISLYGAGITYGWPALVIDAGTALTLTGADEIGTVVGGAILPGLGLQLRSLHAEAAKLPLVDLPQQLPKRWATDTATAIQSGIIYTVVIGLSATITEWLSDYPTSCVVFTGGDAMALLNYVKEWHSSLQEAIAGQGEAISGREHFTIDPNLAFLGISVLSQISRNRHD